MRARALALFVLAGCEPPSVAECIERSDPDLLALELVDPQTGRLQVEPDIRVLSLNVGNGRLWRTNANLRPYALRIHHQAYEDHLAERIAAYRPDIVGLQEVLPRHTCLDGERDWEDESARTCHEQSLREDAVRRLLGPDYSIVCDRQDSVDCLGVHVEFATIVGLESGGYAAEWAQSEGTPAGFDECDYAKGQCQTKAAECDDESSILWADLETLAGESIRALHLHPSAIGDSCRETQLERAFARARENWAEPDSHTIMLGDWNMDPERLGQPVEELLYYANVGPSLRLREHDERDRDCARVRTAPADFATVDRVVTDFAKGWCRVFRSDYTSMGFDEAMGDFDRGFDESTLAGEKWTDRIDHHALGCDLAWPGR